MEAEVVAFLKTDITPLSHIFQSGIVKRALRVRRSSMSYQMDYITSPCSAASGHINLTSDVHAICYNTSYCAATGMRSRYAYTKHPARH